MMNMQIHAQGITISADEKQTIKEQIQRSLQRFSDNVGTVNVYIKDINGPRGGKDVSVVIRARMRGRVELAASALRSKLLSATGAASRRAKRQVKRAIRRQQSFERLNLSQASTTNEVGM